MIKNIFPFTLVFLKKNIKQFKYSTYAIFPNILLVMVCDSLGIVWSFSRYRDIFPTYGTLIKNVLYGFWHLIEKCPVHSFYESFFRFRPMSGNFSRLTNFVIIRKSNIWKLSRSDFYHFSTWFKFKTITSSYI